MNIIDRYLIYLEQDENQKKKMLQQQILKKQKREKLKQTVKKYWKPFVNVADDIPIVAMQILKAKE